MTGLQQLNLVLNTLRIFLKKGSITEGQIEYIKKVLDSIPFFSSPIFDLAFPEVRRVTINRNLFGENKRIEKISFLKYPPAGKVKRYGRANFDGQSVFYAAFDPITVLDELKPNVGDLVTISTWSMHSNTTLNVSPIFKITTKDDISHNMFSINFMIGYENSIKNLPQNVAEQIDALLQFMAECFAKEVDPANHLDYFLSAHFANKILNEYEQGNIEAIVYPSVQKNLGFSNIAMKPSSFENKYFLKNVNECIVKTTPRENGSGYFLESTGWSKTFDIPSDLVVWK